MHDTGTVLCCHIVAWDDTESTLARIEPRDELLIADTHKVCTLECTFKDCKLLLLRIEVCTYESLCHEVEGLLAGIRIR